eukprot:gene13408-19257_t
MLRKIEHAAIACRWERSKERARERGLRIPSATALTLFNTKWIVAYADFFGSPGFTSALGEFLGKYSCELEYKDFAEDQPLKNHDIYQKYTDLVEQGLQKFMLDGGLKQEAVIEACQKAQESGDRTWLTCIDYLLASTEYESFMELAYDHYEMIRGQYEEDECELEAESVAGGSATRPPPAS